MTCRACNPLARGATCVLTLHMILAANSRPYATPVERRASAIQKEAL